MGALNITILMTTRRAGNIFPHPHLILQLTSYFLLSSRMLSRTCGGMDLAVLFFFFLMSSLSLFLFGSPGPLLLCGLSPRAASSAYSLAAVPRFLLVVASLIVDHGL